MADRVDAPRDVMEDGHPDETGPQERTERAEQGSKERPPNEEREKKGTHCQQGKQPIDHDEVRVPMEVRSESLGVCGVHCEQPAGMCPQEPLQRPDGTGSEALRRMGVS